MKVIQDELGSFDWKSVVKGWELDLSKIDGEQLLRAFENLSIRKAVSNDLISDVIWA